MLLQSLLQKLILERLQVLSYQIQSCLVSGVDDAGGDFIFQRLLLFRWFSLRWMVGIGSGREVAVVGCMMVVAAGTDDTEAVEALCLDLRLRIPAGSAKLPGAT